MPNVADLIVRRLIESGVRTLVGMPGGGSNLDVIEAAGRAGLPFVLSHTETAGALIACAQAELTGRPGACLATLGPGVASLVNGAAHACLDRIPLVILTDAMAASGRDIYQHQRLDHAALLAPVTKASIMMHAEQADAEITGALELAMTSPPGPVHIDLAPDVARQHITVSDSRASVAAGHSTAINFEPARALFANARRPIIIAGLGVRDARDADALRTLCEKHGIAALVTYKAKGVIPDEHPLFGGVFTHGALERPIVESADLIIGVGLDPIEFLPRQWDYRAPVVMISRWPLEQRHVPIAASVVGDVVEALQGVDAILPSLNEWRAADIRTHALRQRDAMRITSTNESGWAPWQAVEAAARAAGPDMQVTVDAGAHMFPIMALWPARRTRQILISNGLSTMGFALPSAIGAALLDRTRHVVALTGDGGLLMCLAELGTAARERLKVITVVFNDRSLSLIRIKQEKLGFPAVGMSLDGVDWMSAAKTFGMPAWRAQNDDELARSMMEAAAIDGPTLIEADVDPASYPETMRVLRG
ncbi:MAG: thiamine pyrophosphate-binding protein [Gemmatimonadota bacterium]|nr:thiamine pyrophosphate-binding protein [Gemmatimonadota bacterium]